MVLHKEPILRKSTSKEEQPYLQQMHGIMMCDVPWGLEDAVDAVFSSCLIIIAFTVLSRNGV